MKYKTLFRLWVKLLGIWLAAEAVIELLSAVWSLYVADQYARQQFGSLAELIQRDWLRLLPFSSLVRLGLGWYLFFHPERITNMAIPSNRAYCHECAYDLSMLPLGQHVCPECGTAFRAPAPLKSQTHWGGESGG